MDLGTLRIFPSATVHGRAYGAVHTYAFRTFEEKEWDITELRRHKLTGCMGCRGMVDLCSDTDKQNSLELHSAMTHLKPFRYFSAPCPAYAASLFPSFTSFCRAKRYQQTFLNKMPPP